MTMKTQIVLVSTLLFVCLAAPTGAREQAIINQPNPPDCTTRYYMHTAPVHLNNEALRSSGEYPSVVVKRSASQVGTAPPAARSDPAMLGSRAHSTKMALTRAGHLYP
jgi:hypothetical protein